MFNVHFQMIFIISVMGRIYLTCLDNVRVFTEEGQRAILNFSVVLDTTKDFETFVVTQYGQNPCLLINYDHGQPLGLPVLQNNCTLAPTADLSRGVLDVKLGPVVAGVQGKYQLSSAFQSNELSKCYTVYLLGTPTSPSISASGTHYVGTSLTLTCSSNSTTSPSNHALAMTYSWTLGGDIISEGERFSFDTNLRRQLVIASLARNEDQTVIGCTSTEGKGITSQSSVYTIIISYGPEDIRFNPTDVSQSYNDGDDFNPVTCLADCHPDCNFSWTKGGTSMTYTKVLDLGVVNAAKLGTYTCTATHTIPVHTLTKTLNVSVIYGPDNVSLSPSATSYTVTEGDTLRAIMCSVTCNPLCTYTWSRSGSPVRSTATLDLGKVVREETGSYVCKARNPGSNFSRNGQVVNVTVRYGPDNVSLSSSTMSYTVTEGDNLGPITCSATCNPACTFTWSMSGVTVSSTATLVLNEMKRGEAGSYLCTARNPESNVLKKGPIIGVIVSYAPDVVISQSAFVLNENTPLDLLCKASGVPAVYNYTGFVQRVGEVVVPNSYAESPRVGDNISVNIPSLRLQDTGVYTCYIHNGITGFNKQLIQTASRRIEVSASPHFLLEETNFAGKTTGIITISIPFVSVPSYTSYSVLRHDGQPISTNGKYTLHIRNASVYPLFYGQQVTLAGNVLQITIGDLSENDFGIYKIQITNDINTANVIIDVRATSQPLSLSNLNLSTFKNTVTFEWEKGFNGGHEQTFLLQTSLNSDHSWINRTTIKESDSKYITENGKFQVTLSNLDPGYYRARVVAFNLIGAADPVEFIKAFEIVELNKDFSPKTRVGPIIGGTVGGIAATLVVLVIIVVFIRRKYTYDCDCTCSFNMTKREDMNENTCSEQSLNTKGADNSAMTYEAVSMPNETTTYDSLKYGNNGPDNSLVYTPLNDSSLKTHAYYENVKKEDPVYNNTVLKNQVQTVL